MNAHVPMVHIYQSGRHITEDVREFFRERNKLLRWCQRHFEQGHYDEINHLNIELLMCLKDQFVNNWNRK